MKILITGITALHCTEDYYLRQQLKVVPSEAALVPILREMGHTVEQRVVTWGEDLDSYDKIITYVCGTDSFVAAHTPGALWTLKRKDTLLAFDDWQTDRSIQDGSFKSAAKWRGQFAKQMSGVEHLRDELDELHYDWCHDRHVLAPMFPNGNMDVLFAKSRKAKGKKLWFETQNITIHGYDPNPWLPGRIPEGQVDPSDRKMEWIVAGLNQTSRSYLKKFKPTLPVIELGGRGENGIRMTEPEAIEWFGDYWLHGMPGYAHAGSGWWRSRPSQLAGHGVVTYCDPKEGAIYGPSWVIKDPVALESLSPSELYDLGQRQSKEFFERHPIDDTGKALSSIAVQVFLESV